MASIASIDEICQILTGGLGDKQALRYLKQQDRIGAAAAGATVAGRYFHTWQLNNNWGGGGAAPGGTQRQCTNSTQGAVPYTSPTGGREKFLVAWQANTVTTGDFSIYDRLCDISGFSGTQTGAQSVTLAPTSGAATVAEALENEICIDIYTAIGATATTITVDYLDANGAAATTPAAVIGGAGFNNAQRRIFLPFASGKRGVTSVTSRNLLATTGTVGDYGITIVKKAAPSIPVNTVGMGTKCNMLTQDPDIVKLRSNACLEFVFRSGSTIFAENEYSLSFLER